MYGFRKSAPDETGYLKVTQSGYEIAQELSSATGFPAEDDGRKGWAAPEKWCSFFNLEDELSAWRFHPVKYEFEEEN